MRQSVSARGVAAVKFYSIGSRPASFPLHFDVMADRSARFARYLQRWWERQLDLAGDDDSWTHGRDAHAIAAEFRRDAQFEIAQARFLLRRPKEEAARTIVTTLDPAPSDADSELLVAAIVRAGATAQRIRATTVASGGLTVLALVIRGILRRR
jgi:hypothetical protein